MNDDLWNILHWSLTYACQNGEITLDEYKKGTEYLLKPGSSK